MENFDPRPGQIWKHYKGGMYRIITLAKNSESEDPYDMIVYQKVGEDNVLAQSLGRFLESVKFEGQNVPRFTFISDN